MGLLRSKRVNGYTGYIRIKDVYIVLAVIVGGVFVALCVAAVLIPFDETILLRGRVVDGTVELRATRSGSVEQVHFKEFDVVNMDSSFVTINVGETILYEKERYHVNNRILEARIEQKRAQLDALKRKESIRRQLHQGLIQQNDDEIKRQRQRLEILENMQTQQKLLLKDVEQLESSRYLSRQDVNGLKYEFLDTSLKINEAEGNHERLKTERSALVREEELADAENAISAAQYQEQILELEQQLSQAQSTRSVGLPAMVNGVLSRVYVAPGDFVNEGDILATVRPADNTFELQLFASSRHVGKIEGGQSVRIKYDAYPYADYGIYPGVVSRVGGEPNLEMTSGAELKTAPTFLVKVALESPYVNYASRRFPVVSGSTVEASITIEEKTVATWLFSSLLRFITR